MLASEKAEIEMLKAELQKASKEALEAVTSLKGLSLRMSL